MRSTWRGFRAQRAGDPVQGRTERFILTFFDRGQPEPLTLAFVFGLAGEEELLAAIPALDVEISAYTLFARHDDRHRRQKASD